MNGPSNSARDGATAPPLAGHGESWRDLLHLFSYIRPWRGRFIVALVALLISMSFGLMFPFLVGHLLDAAIPSIKHISAPPWMRDVDTIALVLLGTLAVQAALTFFSSYTFNKVGERAVVSLRRQLYERLISMPMKFFGEHRVGELASRLSSDLGLLEDVLISAVPQALRQAMLLIGGVAIIAVTSLRLSLVMLSSFPVLMIVAVVFGRRIRKLSRTAQDRLADTGTIVDETLQGIANVKAFGNEEYEVRRYTSQLEAFLASVLRTAKHRAALIAFIIVAIFGSIVLVLWDGARLMQAGVLSHGELTRFVFCTIFVGGSVSSFAEVYSALQRAMGATQRVRELLTEPAESRLDSPLRQPALAIRLGGEVSFEDVHFRYPSRPDLPVLRGLSLRAGRGEKVALVGPSGAGKSTIVSLLLRFYEPDQGCVRLDGKNAADFPLETVRANMAIVPQEVLLFGGSIRENIAYGKPGAGEEEIIAASRRANCHEFIERFPERYMTLVGERGVKLSGGQRQRIAIARALLKDPAILILDEATSSLDSESEQLIQQALATLLAGRTAFVIAHRLSTVRQVDRIYVIEDGAVTESGAHGELIERPAGMYRRLSALQFASPT
jgi:ATP-binding cassette subfamily B protein